MADEVDEAAVVNEDFARRATQAISDKLAPSGITECVDCLVDILPARLEALPSATRCAMCQETVERRL